MGRKIKMNKLIKLIKKKKYKKIAKMVHKEPSLLSKIDESFGTPLCYACKWEDFEGVKFLVELGADVNEIGNSSGLPIRDAVLAIDDKAKKIALLIEYGANIDAVVHDITPFCYAVINGNIEAVNELLKYNIDINFLCKKRSPLNYAFEKEKDWPNDDDYQKIVEVLNTHGAQDIDERPKKTMDELMIEYFIHIFSDLTSCISDKDEYYPVEDGAKGIEEIIFNSFDLKTDDLIAPNDKIRKPTKDSSPDGILLDEGILLTCQSENHDFDFEKNFKVCEDYFIIPKQHNNLKEENVSVVYLGGFHSGFKKGKYLVEKREELIKEVIAFEKPFPPKDRIYYNVHSGEDSVKYLEGQFNTCAEIVEEFIKLYDYNKDKQDLYRKKAIEADKRLEKEKKILGKLSH